MEVEKRMSILWEDDIMKTKSARSKGAVGKNAIIPRIIPILLKDVENPFDILDFGCGKDMVHVLELQMQGFSVSGYDINLPGTEKHLERAWDIIYLSNVINVQSTKEELDDIFDLVWMSLHRVLGIAMANYPNKPRYLGWTVKEMEDYLKTRFLSVLRVEKEIAGNNVVWVMR